MAVFLTGDTHGEIDFAKVKAFAQVAGTLTRDDHLVILGDFGLVWSDPPTDGERSHLDWLEAQLDAAAETGKPIFVFNHYPASRIGQGHDRYAALVTKYPNTFVIVGHMHYYIRFGRLYGAHVTPEIWVPCLSMMDENGEANDKTGLGYLLEVYDDEVVFRGMNFYEGRLTDVEQRYALQTPQAEEPEIPPAIGF